ncbi:MAG: hypothetical protein JWN48_5738, partial [Myxococcaceae bacterium]|nr:hypothetical protein [Myxococcaceae bacterium]
VASGTLVVYQDTVICDSTGTVLATLSASATSPNPDVVGLGLVGLKIAHYGDVFALETGLRVLDNAKALAGNVAIYQKDALLQFKSLR